MATRSLNKVCLIGNLTRDPELRYTPQGTAVCTLGLATNRYWVTEAGEKREETEFHRIVAWNKLAELCAQLLFKGRKVYVEGRLQTRAWTAQDGTQRQTTEIVIEDMIILDSRRQLGEGAMPTAGEAATQVPAKEPPQAEVPKEAPQAVQPVTPTDKGKKKKKTEKTEKETKAPSEDIPF